MARFVDRRTFLTRGGAAALAVAASPWIRPMRASAANDKLVVAVGQWGIETPFAWRTSQSEKCLWDQAYDSLIGRDPKTFAYRPGLATEWKPSNEMKTWTFKLRPGVQFHEGFGE
jgi:peptide/nickel transport system substrate-binding protein